MCTRGISGSVKTCAEDIRGAIGDLSSKKGEEEEACMSGGGRAGMLLLSWLEYLHELRSPWIEMKRRDVIGVCGCVFVLFSISLLAYLSDVEESPFLPAATVYAEGSIVRE